MIRHAYGTVRIGDRHSVAGVAWLRHCLGSGGGPHPARRMICGTGRGLAVGEDGKPVGTTLTAQRGALVGGLVLRLPFHGGLSTIPGPCARPAGKLPSTRAGPGSQTALSHGSRTWFSTRAKGGGMRMALARTARLARAARGLLKATCTDGDGLDGPVVGAGRLRRGLRAVRWRPERARACRRPWFGRACPGKRRHAALVACRGAIALTSGQLARSKGRPYADAGGGAGRARFPAPRPKTADAPSRGRSARPVARSWACRASWGF